MAVVMLAGCGTTCRCCRPATAGPASAPESVEVDGRQYTLTASLWRDFQPVAPPNGQPLAAVLKVLASDMMPLPADLAIDHVWVLNGEKQWSATADQPQGGREQSAATYLEEAVHGGPKWGPGIKVDVVVRLKRGKQKQTWLVRQAGVTIKRTD